ncbi:MAG: MFS transporter [Fidelibacterota bacterium]
MATRESKTIIIITGLSHFAVHSSMLFFPALLLVFQNEFSAEPVSLAKLGWIYTLSNFMFGLGAIPAGWIEGKVGGRKLLLVYQFGAAVSALMAALSWNLAFLTIALVFLGLFSSIYHPAGLTIISRRIRQTSRAMGYHGIAGSAGLAAGPIFASLMAVTGSWRMAYATIGIFCLFLAWATKFFIPARKSEVEEDIIQTEITRMKPLAIYYLIAVFIGLTFYGFKTYMPVHFSLNATGLLEKWDIIIRGGLFSTIVLLAGIGGQIIGGRLGDRYNRPNLLVLIFMIQTPVLIAFGLSTGPSVLVWGVLLGVLHFSHQPVGNSLIAQYTTSLNRGMGYGISFFLSFGLGSFASGISGSLAESHGVQVVFPFVAIFMACAFLLALYLRKIS